MKKRLIVLMLALVLGVSFLGTASAAIDKKPGDTFTVNVVCKGADVYAYVIALNYDASVLENTGVTSGRKIADGEITTAGADLYSAYTGKTVMTASFKVKAGTEGKTAAITITEMQPSKDADKNVVDGKWSGGTTINVVGDAPEPTAEPTAAPTATPEPTAAPTPAPTWSPWKVRTPATCTTAGVEYRTMGDKEEIRAIPALGHDWGAWKVVKAATCTVKGSEERVCKRDATHKETRDIAMLAHKEGAWEVVREATKDMPGLRVIKCQVGGEILKQEEIPFQTTRYFYSNTASTQGFSFRDMVPGLTKEWVMFTPVDLSQEGEQTIPLIASNMYYIGHVTLNVAGGNVTATYEVGKGVKVKSEFLTMFPDLASVTEVDPKNLGESAKAFGEPVSIQDELGGDTKVLLYANLVVDYNDDLSSIQRYSVRHPNYTSVVEGLRALMD